jgi:Pvc16 N-terminal domain
MADVGAPHAVGESIVALLRARRALLADAGQLGAVPGTQDIAHVPVAKLVSATPPTSGLSLTCYHVMRSDHAQAATAGGSGAAGIGISLELHYLLASWAGTASEELALISWAMLELTRYPVLGPGQLQGSGWARDEAIQLVPGSESTEQLARLWDAFKSKYRLSTTYRARIVRIGYGTADDGPAVIASRFSFAAGDVAVEPSL